MARGMAVVATADNPSAIYFNPAGITQLQGHNLRGGLYGVYLTPSFQSSAGRFHDEEPLHAIPQLFYAYGMETLPLSFGVGVYSPFGLGTRYPQDTGFRTLGTQGKITTDTINPVVAWRVLTNLSIAAGLRVDYAEADLRQGLVWPSQSLDEFRFKGSGWGVGYNLGVLWKPIEQVSLGATFRGPTTINLGGHTEYRNDAAFPPGVGAVSAVGPQTVIANGDFPFPLSVVCGLSYRPTPKWNLEFDAQYTDWSALGTLTINQAAGNAALGLPKNIPMAFNWEGSWYYELGATRYLGKGWSVSGGYIFNENSVPDAHYSPLVGDLDRHFFSVGTGFKGKRFDFDVACQFGYGPTRTVTGSAPSATGQTANGDYQFLSQAVCVSVGWHF